MILHTISCLLLTLPILSILNTCITYVFMLAMEIGLGSWAMDEPCHWESFELATKTPWNFN
jgi:hypothetical protein